MALSPQYLALCKRLSELRRGLLPAVFDPTGNYAADVFDKTRGFVALAHAEIEAYIEDRCLEVAAASVAKWNQSRLPNRVVFALHCLCYTGWAELGHKSIPQPTQQVSVEARVNTALDQYKIIVGDNHGIKEDNLKWLLVPLSIRMKGDLDITWLSNMSSFGATRGGIVHQPGRANNRPDPKDSLAVVWRDLVAGLKQLDQLLTSLL